MDELDGCLCSTLIEELITLVLVASTEELEDIEQPILCVAKLPELLYVLSVLGRLQAA